MKNETVERLMHSNLMEVFNERDPQRRGSAIDRTYAEDVRWTDDEGVTVGTDALDAKAEQLQQQLGDLRFREAGPVEAYPGSDTWHGSWCPGGGAVAASGFDVAIISGDRIVSLYTVLT